MKLEVTLNGKRYELDNKRGYTILAILRRNTLNPPFSCTEGRCGKCKAKLVSGIVTQESGTGLGIKEKQQGYILTCRSIAESEIVVEF